jgi:hypothetical protein
VQFVILQFHHGVKITPVAPPQVGNFDPEKIERYAATGTAIPSCSHVGAMSDTVARCMSRGQRKSS